MWIGPGFPAAAMKRARHAEGTRHGKRADALESTNKRERPMTTTIYVKATVPDDLAQGWLQHLRDFDTAHPGCHFEVVVESETKSVGDVMRTIDIHPALATQFFAQRKR